MNQPLVSIITPSYQQGKFIQETIESVLSQDYSNLEHIVIDGGSTDSTVEVLKSYNYLGERFRWVSEKDRGQSHAINKGLNMAKGEIIGWLNSDDTYMPNAVKRAVSALQQNTEWGMVYGRANYTDEQNQVIGPYPIEPFNRKRLYEGCIICQPAAFIRKEAFDMVGGIDENFHFCMDYDLWMRISKHYPIGFIEHVLATSRMHNDSKTMTQYFDVGLPEIIRASIKNYGSVSNQWMSQYFSYIVSQDPKNLWKHQKRTE
ncbi:glycosyltransferase family 2 protein [Bacillus sp. FJAT-53711]|uniref:Glycosyltransferase family 2 protein n=1 Tax=Bacillus yunxiaonensis TaxID=3127665 RepID=A0ABU8FT92_9BACI